MPADAFCRQIDSAGKSKPLTRQRFLIPCTGAYLAYLPQLELHSDRFVGTFTPFRIKSTPFRNGHLDSLFFFFLFYCIFPKNARTISEYTAKFSASCNRKPYRCQFIEVCIRFRSQFFKLCQRPCAAGKPVCEEFREVFEAVALGVLLHRRGCGFECISPCAPAGIPLCNRGSVRTRAGLRWPRKRKSVFLCIPQRRYS